uniref:Large ribosomal subunit protein uL2m n=1 Tax=Lepidodinium chlorophorum TaxID=107758 RepID=A0A0F7R5Z8_LEPCH|nr:ribosomal protein L2 [Lepidodinium chlorophorum]BAR72297.1 ribosomal protein L2 [Lepidodinium chlorophorum]
MNLYYFGSISPGIRYTTSNVFKKAIRHKFNKHLFRSNVNIVRRRGKIVCRHRIGRHKRLYRIIDFWRNKIYKLGYVCSIEYDPNRNSSIARITYSDKTQKYILAPNRVHVGAKIIAGFQVPIENGNSLPLWNIPLGTNVHNVELYPGSGGKLGRSAGMLINLIAREQGFVTLRLPSGKLRLVSQMCWRTIGQVSNVTARNIKLGKRGRMFWLGRRSMVRGSVINPVDHPHGGGEGRRSIGHIHPCTPWGKPRLGRKTRHLKKYSNAFFV